MLAFWDFWRFKKMRKLHVFLILSFITIPCIADDCMKEIAPEYDDWVEWNRPECWCYKKQCRGDINGASFLGKPISLADLTIFKAAFNQPDEVLRQNPELICADLNHGGFLGKRVTLSDLNILKGWFHVMQIPCCDLDEDCILTTEDKYNFWTN
jgi:hypothetical protein